MCAKSSPPYNLIESKLCKTHNKYIRKKWIAVVCEISENWVLQSVTLVNRRIELIQRRWRWKRELAQSINSYNMWQFYRAFQNRRNRVRLYHILFSCCYFPQFNGIHNIAPNLPKSTKYISENERKIDPFAHWMNQCVLMDTWMRIRLSLLFIYRWITIKLTHKLL